MRIFIAGQKSFGAEVLNLVRSLGHEVAGVSAPYLGPSGGSGGLADRLRDRAARQGVDVMPAGALDASTLPDDVDLIVAAHSHDFIGRRTRLACRLGAVGYHPSLLPLHRGRDSVEWQIRMRERVGGGTVYWLGDTVDGGPVAAQEYCFIRPEDTASGLWGRELYPMGIRLLKRVLLDLEAGRVVRAEQDNTLATWEPAIDPPPLRRPDLTEIWAGREDPAAEHDEGSRREHPGRDARSRE